MARATYLGHAAVLIESAPHAVIIDPFLTGQRSPVRPEDVRVDAVLVTHGHGDHVGDTVAIAKANDAVVVAPSELAGWLARQGAKTHAMHIGGSRQFDFGWVKLTPALHGSAVVGESIVYTGNPCGFLVRMGGKLVYHAGDTGLSAEMDLIGRRNCIDLAFVPVGDNYTMGVDDAAEAVRMLRPRQVVPMHYGTFPGIEADTDAFARGVGPTADVVVLKPGEATEA